MTITRTYSCNLCRDTKDPSALVGLYWKDFPKGWEQKPARETENHICTTCLSSLQAFAPRCGQGFECEGGPRCGSDHK